AVDRRPRRADALDGERKIEQRVRRVPGGILDRKPGDTCRHDGGDILPDARRFHREATLEIGIDRYVRACRDGAEMCEGVLDRDTAVGAAERPCKPGARRRERWKPELRQQAG